jgi:hypothetical protein
MFRSNYPPVAGKFSSCAKINILPVQVRDLAAHLREDQLYASVISDIDRRRGVVDLLSIRSYTSPRPTISATYLICEDHRSVPGYLSQNRNFISGATLRKWVIFYLAEELGQLGLRLHTSRKGTVTSRLKLQNRNHNPRSVNVNMIKVFTRQQAIQPTHSIKPQFHQKPGFESAIQHLNYGELAPRQDQIFALQKFLQLNLFIKETFYQKTFDSAI